MSPLNFHHLRYFWAIVREGGVSRAAEKLRVSQPSLSAQLRTLEEAVGHKLFAREGRRLVATETGRLVFAYAEQIFGLGAEMVDALQDRPAGQPMRMSVGISNAVPKRIAYRLLAPVFRLKQGVRVECIEDRPEQLLADLAVHRLDAVISDAPAPTTVRVQAFSHLLGESAIAIAATGKLAAAHRRGFPRSLDGAPMLLPTTSSSLRRALESWFEREGLRPRVVAELDDPALMEVLGQNGLGVYPVPMAITPDVRRRSGLEVVGRVPAVRERYYALTIQRRLKHPGVVVLSEQARVSLGAR